MRLLEDFARCTLLKDVKSHLLRSLIIAAPNFTIHRFITFDDMLDLVGTSTEHAALEQIWRDSLQECKAHLDRITYDDFKLLMKGQPKEPRRSVQFQASGGMLMPTDLLETKSKALDVVPEGPSNIKGQSPSSKSLVDHFNQEEEQRLADERRGAWGKKRSKSYEQKATVWDNASISLSNDEDMDLAPPLLERDASRALMLPGCVAGDVQHTELISDSSLSPLFVNRALYRKHREMRLAVLDASKQFDKKRHEIRDKSNPQVHRASLIMKRGERPPVELEDAHQRALFEAAARRCGRQTRSRRSRNKTVSDVTGMLMKAEQTVE